MPARKPGKLPSETVSAEYILEYGVDALEMHADALAHGARVLIHDDLLATGGTAQALAELVEGLGATVVGFAFLVELEFLEGRRRLEGYDVHALISYAATRWSSAARARSPRRSTTSGRSSATPTTCRAGGRACSGWRA